MDSGKGEKWAMRYKVRCRTKTGEKFLMEGVQMPKLSCGPNTIRDARRNPPWKTRWSLCQVGPQDLVWEGALKVHKLKRKDRLHTLILSAGRKAIELQLSKCLIYEISL